MPTRPIVSRPVSARSSRPLNALPADLLKLRQRFSRTFPAAKARADRLSSVPAAFRHLLSMQLDLERDETLPRRYRSLVEAGGLAGNGGNAQGDEVDQLVVTYGDLLRGGQVNAAADLSPQLDRFFTEPQIVEMTLLAVLAQGLAVFEAVLARRQ